jgi:L-glutamine-phosphate cytidylyltransferase
MMRALILAAGRGSRMGNLSDDRPKCLVELEGKPLIERQIAALRRGGVDQIGVVRGYRAEMIDLPGLFYFANERWAETNMVMSLAAAAAWLGSGPVIVSYADIFYRGDLVRGLAGAPGQLVVSYDRAWRRLWTRRFTDPLADAETFRTNASGQMPRANCWKSAVRPRGSKISRGNTWASSNSRRRLGVRSRRCSVHSTERSAIAWT